jgi:hypothetical protein
METFVRIRNKFLELIEEKKLDEVPIQVRVRGLTPEQAIGNPTDQDYPLIKGRERLLEAEILGSRGHAFTDAPGDFSGTLKEAIESPEGYGRLVLSPGRAGSYSLASITLVALIRTKISSPTLTPRSLTASVLMREVTMLPPPTSTFTFAITMPSFTSVTFPFRTFRVLSFIGSSFSMSWDAKNRGSGKGKQPVRRRLLTQP